MRVAASGYARGGSFVPSRRAKGRTCERVPSRGVGGPGCEGPSTHKTHFQAGQRAHLREGVRRRRRQPPCRAALRVPARGGRVATGPHVHVKISPRAQRMSPLRRGGPLGKPPCAHDNLSLCGVRCDGVCVGGGVYGGRRGLVSLDARCKKQKQAGMKAHLQRQQHGCMGEMGWPAWISSVLPLFQAGVRRRTWAAGGDGGGGWCAMK